MAISAQPASSPAPADACAETGPELKIFSAPSHEMPPRTGVFDSVDRFQNATIEELQSLIPYSDGKPVTSNVQSIEEVRDLWNAESY